MVFVRRLSHRYASTEVLRLPAWDVGRGERWLVLGLSGCGKTTLLHTLAGLIRPAEGEVRVAQQHYPVTGLAWRAEELWLAAAALAVGLIAALVPAWRAYRIDVSRTLARG